MLIRDNYFCFPKIQSKKHDWCNNFNCVIAKASSDKDSSLYWVGTMYECFSVAALSLKKWSGRNFTEHSAQSFSFATKGEQEWLEKKFTKLFRVPPCFAHVVFEEKVQMNPNDATLPLKSWQQRPDVRAVGTGPRCQADNQSRTGTRTRTKGSSLRHPDSLAQPL